MSSHRTDQTSENTPTNHPGKKNLLFLWDSNGRFLRLKKLCPHHDVIYEQCSTVGKAIELINDTDPSRDLSTILLHCGTNDLEHISDPKVIAQEI